MLFSAKITNSIINFLEEKGHQLDSLYDCCDIQIEFLKDPTFWLEAGIVEHFLAKAEEIYGTSLEGVDLLSGAGHSCYTLKSWGVLDSVLKMMQRPQDIYEQPGRIISYFVTPAPPIGHFVKSEHEVCFELPIFSQEFPLVTEYLRSALEALPAYVGKTMSHVTWEENKISISYVNSQAALFDNINEKNHISPELFQSMISTIEQSQLELQRKNEDLQQKEQEIKLLKTNLDNITKITSKNSLGNGSLSESKDEIKVNVLRLNDYLARAQQLITMLVGQGRKDTQVQRAMKRVNWDSVLINWQKTVRSILEDLDQRHEVHSPKNNTKESEQQEFTKH